ncbi:pectinesterase-like [Salvia hispanica]|uniref:pectinesterase-like n=1 Tax=Salvia hispanica TaxID=49212 RepID=UPI002009AE71|nr:pectinesterase-like [Salvia hispanica]
MEKMKPDTHNKNNLKFLIIVAFLSLLVDGAAAAHSHKHHSRGEYAPASAAVRSSCAATRSPDLCLSTSAAAFQASAFKINGISELKKSLKTFSSETIKVAIERLEIVQRQQKSLTRRDESAFHDCRVMIYNTAKQIGDSEDILNKYSESPDAAHKMELYNLLSAAQTNVFTCIDGFSHSEADKLIQAKILKTFLSNLYRKAKYLMSKADETFKELKDQPVKSGMGEEWPEWLSIDDRKLLQDPAGKVVPDLTVAKKGGDYQTVSEAVAKAKEDAPKKSGKRYVIWIKEGEYMENVVIPMELTNLTFVGDGYDKTFIIASKNVVDGDTSFSSATVGVAGDGFIALDITFKNTAGPSKLQAVALRVNADRAVFYNCHMIGYQNTLYVHSLRQFYKKCTISGTVYFIFGNAAAFFLDCDIQARPPNSGLKNKITAQGRELLNQNTGIVIQKCRITAELDAEGKFTTYLGWAWGEYSRTVVMQTEISGVIHPPGWSKWKGKFALNWNGFQVLKDVEPFTIGNFLGS